MSTLTLDTLRDAWAKVEALKGPPAVQVWPTAHWPKVEDGTEIVRFEAHPLVRWLARWLPITPYVEATYPKYRDADPIMDQTRGILFCSRAQADRLRRELSQK